MVSTTIETENPEEELKPAIDLLGPVLEMFVNITDTFSPLDSGKENGLWITKSYEPSSHFEIAADDILDIYEKITNEKLDLNIEPDEDEGDY